jgi:hypothetical protein
MSAPRFGRDARNHRLEAGSPQSPFWKQNGWFRSGRRITVPPSADGDKLSHPLGISGQIWVRFSDKNGAEFAESIVFKVDMPF